jgi:hypothetical protein
MNAVAFLLHGYRAGGDRFDLFIGKVHNSSPFSVFPIAPKKPGGDKPHPV